MKLVPFSNIIFEWNTQRFGTFKSCTFKLRDRIHHIGKCFILPLNREFGFFFLVFSGLYVFFLLFKRQEFMYLCKHKLLYVYLFFFNLIHFQKFFSVSSCQFIRKFIIIL